MAIDKTNETLTITAAGVTQAFYVNDAIDEYNILADTGSVILAGNIIISSAGTPQTQTTFNFRFGGGFTLGAFTCQFFGVNLTEAQCLFEQYISAVYNGATWNVSISSDMSSGRKDLRGQDVVDGSIPNVALAGNIDLTKLANTGVRGQVVRTGVNGVIETANAANTAAVLGGDGTDVLQQIVGGDVTKAGATWTIANNAITTVKVLDANITPAKLTTELRTEVITYPCSFETSEVGATTIIIPFACSVTAVRAVASKVIAATDAGTVVLKDNALTTMTVTTPISFAASDLLGTAYSSAVTANNTFTAGQVLTVLTAKATVGGRVLLSITLLRA